MDRTLICLLVSATQGQWFKDLEGVEVCIARPGVIAAQAAKAAVEDTVVDVRSLATYQRLILSSSSICKLVSNTLTTRDQFIKYSYLFRYARGMSGYENQMNPGTIHFN